MRRCIYGHPESGTQFVRNLSGLLLANGWRPSGADHAVLANDKGLLLARVHVLKNLCRVRIRAASRARSSWSFWAATADAHECHPLAKS